MRSWFEQTIALLALFGSQAVAAERDAKELEPLYASAIRPLVTKYCQDCHGKELQEAELDLTAFANFGDVRKHPQAWQKVGEMLDTAQMPPKDAPQPTADERKQLQSWVHDYLTM